MRAAVVYEPAFGNTREAASEDTRKNPDHRFEGELERAREWGRALGRAAPGAA